MRSNNVICAILGSFIGIAANIQETPAAIIPQENTFENGNEHTRLLPLKKLIGKINIFKKKLPDPIIERDLIIPDEQESSSDELMKLSDISPKEKIERIQNSILASPREPKVRQACTELLNGFLVDIEYAFNKFNLTPLDYYGIINDIYKSSRTPNSDTLLNIANAVSYYNIFYNDELSRVREVNDKDICKERAWLLINKLQGRI